jgi:hypothetical protein
VYEYLKKFNYLTQYGTHHVDTGEKKAELFRRGLSLPLQERLVQFCDTSFNTLVCAMIAQDGTYQTLLAEEEEKRKSDLSEPSDDSTKGAPPKYCLVYSSSMGKSRVPPAPSSPRRTTTHLSSKCYLRSLSRLSHSRCYPRHLSHLLSLYYLMHLSRRLQ